jgi:hypothetical protein
MGFVSLGLSCLVALAVLTGSMGFGAAALRILGLLPRGTLERVVWSAAVGQPLYALAALGAGVLGFFGAPPARVLAALTAAGWVAGLAAAPWRGLGRRAKASPWTTRALGGLILLATLYACLRAATPPTEKDTLGYHFAAPQRYLQEGRISMLEGNPRAWYPALAQMFWMSALAFDGPGAAQLLNVLQMLLAAGALALLGRRTFGAESGTVAAAIFVGLYQSRRLGATGSDMFFLSFFAAAALLAAVRAIEQPGLRRFGLCGVALGAAAGVKIPGLIVVAAVLATLALLGRRRGAAVATAAVVAALIASPWYGRLTAYTGNPLWPFLPELLGHGPYSPEGLERLLTYIADSQEEVPWIYGVTLFRSHWLLAAAALLLWWRPWRRPAGAVVVAWVLGAAAWWLSSSQSRLGMPYHGWLAVLAGGGLVAAARQWPRVARPLGVAALLAVAFGLHHREFGRVRDGLKILTGRMTAAEHAAREHAEFDAYAWVNAHAPREVVLLYNSNALYWRQGPCVAGHVLMQDRWRWRDARTPEEFWAMVRSTGAAYVLVATGGLEPDDPARWAERPVMLGTGAAVYAVPR